MQDRRRGREGAKRKGNGKDRRRQKKDKAREEGPPSQHYGWMDEWIEEKKTRKKILCTIDR